jgi:predicted ATPase
MAVIGSEQKLALYEATATFSRGWVLVQQGQAKSGLSEMHKGIAACLELGMRLWQPYQQGALAEAYLQAGEPQVGLDVVDQAIRFVNDRGAHFCEAEVLRLKGNLLAHVTPHQTEAAEACYHEALTIAQRQQAKSLELRAAMSLARFWRDQGRRDEARDLLAAIYGWFTEGFDTPDLKDAKTLLDQLN